MDFARNSLISRCRGTGCAISRARILVPIVFPSMPNENASHFLNLLNEVAALHATSNSATFRTAGMCPPDKSAYRSRRCSCRSCRDSPCVM
jgi:hypothetical protein